MPAGSMGQPEDLLGALLWLVSPAARHWPLSLGRRKGYKSLAHLFPARGSLSTQRESNMTNDFRFGIIGCGVIGATHAEAINSLPGAQLAAVADIVPANARQLANKYAARAYTDPREMIA